MTDTEAAPLNDLTNSIRIHLHIDMSFLNRGHPSSKTTDVTIGGPQ